MRLALANLTNRIVRYLSRSDRATRAAALLRNQCGMLIGYHLAPNSNLEDNGEAWLLDRVAPHIRRFVDVGANRGEWSAALLGRNTSSTGIAVDAGTAAVECLHALALKRLTVVHAAVSDAVGEATFFEQPDAGEWSSLSALHSRQAVALQVPQITLDGLIQDSGWRDIDLLKVDAEGWDLRCLLGAEKALAAQSIAIIQFEYNAPWVDAGCTLKAAIDYLEGHGYIVAALRPDGLMSYDYGRFGEFFQYSNFVAFTAAASAWLQR